MGSEKIRTYHRANSVVFLKTNERFGGLSNMASGYPLCVNSHHILTAEALYQACRFPHMPEVQRQIIEQRSPMTAKMKSKRYRNNSRPDWHQVRVSIMRWCLRVKLVQNWQKFSHLLLKSGDLPIVEQSGKDDFWGAKPMENGTLVGINVLGRLLMELREEVVRSEKTPLFLKPIHISNFLLDGQEIETVSSKMIVSGRFLTSANEKQAQLFGNPLARREDTVQEGLGRWERRKIFSGHKYYPAMKDSGVEWLGNVPEHWDVRKLRNILYSITKRNRPDLPLLSVVREKGVIVRDISSKDENHNFIPDDLTNYKVVLSGQFAMNKMKAWQGSYGISQYDGIVSPAYFIFNIRFVQSNFFHAAIRSKAYVPFFTHASDGVRIGQWDLSQARMREIVFCAPPISEQISIVRYLDYVEQRVRQIVQAKQKLIELLKEQKQTIIQHAVIRGLDPDVSLKDSGVKWLGEVPVHWQVRRLRNVTDMRVSNVDKHVKAAEVPVRLCNYVDVYKNDRISEQIDFMRATATGEEIERFRLSKGDVLITKDSETWDDIGVPALVTNPTPDLVSGYHLALLRPYIDEISGEYFLRTLQSKGLAHQFYVKANGVTRYGLTHTAIKSVWLPLPPLPEQTAIVEYLDRATADIDTTTARACREIELLQEYRTRLIADVVTGKVDVRGVANSLPSQSDDAESLADGIISDSEASEQP